MAEATKEELAASNHRLRAMVARVREETQSGMAKVARGGAAGGGAWLLSYIEHRYPDRAQVFGVDISLAAGIAAAAVSASGMIKDETADHIVEGLGIGGFSAWASKKGAIRGDKDKQDDAAKAA